MKVENTRDDELREEFVAGLDPESPAVLKRRIDDLEQRLATIEKSNNFTGKDL